MTGESSHAIDRRHYIILATGLVCFVLGIPAYIEYVTNVPMMAGFAVEEPGPHLDWWVQPAMAISAIAGIYGILTGFGIIHRPPKTTDEILEDHSNDN